MSTELDCLSLMELLDLHADRIVSGAGEHVEACPRCRALLEGLPDDLRLPELRTTRVRTAGPVRRSPGPGPVRTGGLWRAMPDSPSDFGWVVAIIGRAPDAEGRIVVAPISGEPHLATDADLLLDASPLGYEAFIDVGNLGVLLEDQLVEPVAELPRETAQALVALYRATLGVGEWPSADLVGAQVVDKADPRLLAAAQRADELRGLWRAADKQVLDVSDDLRAASATQELEIQSLGDPLRISDVLSARLSGPEAEWDRSGLLEASRAGGARLDAFLDDRLDLTDKRDIDELARVLHALEVPWEEVEPAVSSTLALSPGGTRRAEGQTLRMAARSRPGMSDEETTEHLYADQSGVDTSIDARHRETGKYLAELQQALDDLDY